ncbi:MAG: hypothetical protein K0U98_28515 [Deltaproteobacteria bacterium]|nr:hypothetical protein [Deltaproteobacteria bacterium]
MTTRFSTTPFSKALSLVLLAFLALVPVTTSASQDQDANPLFVAHGKLSAQEVQAALDDEFFAYQVFELDLPAIDQQVRTHGRLSLHLGNRVLDLELEENDLRSPDFRWVELSQKGVRDLDPGPVTTFKGTVDGDSESVVRLSVTPELFSGFIFANTEMLFIDPVVDFIRDSSLPGGELPANGDVVVYREIDQRHLIGGTCETGGSHGFGDLLGSLPGSRHDALGSLGFDLSSEAQPGISFRTLEVALECDGQYRARFGQSGAINRMQGIMNDVDGFIYRSELNIGINVVFAGCWPNAGTDPYTSLNASTTLSQMATFWSTGGGGGIATNRDVVHQFSGKNFSGSTIGIAYVGVICRNRTLSVGISQDVSGSASRRRLTAHEIGHNLSANHDTGVNCSGNGPVMCPSIQSGGSSAADDFSNASFNSIENFVTSFGGCI